MVRIQMFHVPNTQMEYGIKSMKFYLLVTNVNLISRWSVSFKIVMLNMYPLHEVHIQNRVRRWNDW